MNKTDAINIINILKNTYPEATCSLDFTTPFEMVVSVMLSAQCTDARVNQITPELFNLNGIYDCLPNVLVDLLAYCIGILLSADST